MVEGERVGEEGRGKREDYKMSYSGGGNLLAERLSKASGSGQQVVSPERASASGFKPPEITHSN